MSLRWLAAALLLSLAAAPAWADKVTVRAARHESEGFARIAFDWPAPVAYDAQIEGETLRVRFARPIEADFAAVTKYLGDYVGAIAVDDDGVTVRATLKKAASLRGLVEGRVVAIDLVTSDAAVAPPSARPAAQKPVHAAVPAKPAAESAATAVAIRFSEHQGFRRVVFDWHGAPAYTFAAKDGIARLTFERKGALDSHRLGAAFPSFAAEVEEAPAATVVTLHVPDGVSFHHFRSEGAIILDVLAKPARPRAATPAAKAPAPGDIVPPPEMIEPSAGTPSEEEKPPLAVPRPAAAAAPPRPPAVLTAHAALAPEGASLRFDWPVPTPAAVYRRGAALWIVFAGAKQVDLTEARQLPGIQRIDQVPQPKATVLRLEPRAGINASVRRADNGWVLDLRPQEAHADAPIAIEPEPEAATPRVLFRVSETAEPITLRDPDVGDMVTVIPVSGLGRGIGADQGFVDFEALASVQGIAIRPIADDLRIERTGDGIAVSRPGGLSLSSEGDRRLATVSAGHGGFDFARWQGRSGESFLDRRSRLEQAVAAAPRPSRTKARLDLARFYFANLYAAEAEGVLAAIERDDPAAFGQPVVVMLSGAVRLLAGDRKGASDALGQKLVEGEPDIGLWRASLAVENGEWGTAATLFAPAAGLLSRYPKGLRDRFALQAAEAFLETGQPAAADPMIRLVLKGEPALPDKAMALYLQGRQALAQDDYAHAVELWSQVAAMDDRPSRARALFARISAEYDAAQVSRADAIKTLEQLRFAWRGDRIEFQILKKLGELKLADGDQRGGFDILREAALNFPDDPQSKELMKELSDSLADVLLGKESADVSPVKALTLYDEFKDYAPVGERGDAIVRRLVDRLVAVDLLDRAAALLEDQVEHRLAGRDKARGAAQLALIRLFDHHPEEALKALDIAVDKDLPAELMRQRQQLRARALAELGRNDEALAMLASDTSRDADRLRADIYWRARNWGEAAKVFARIVPPPAAEAKLDAGASQIVLNWAAALTLAGDQKGLDDLRAHYGRAMAATPFADAFSVVAGEPGGGEGDPRALANRVAQLGELQSFMASYKERLAKEKLSAIN
jgi:tetratricopeptide (TPR) repeat protein